MKKISVKNIVLFQRKSDKSRKTFLKNLTKTNPSKLDDSSGGDYWVRSLSALSNAIKEKNNKPIKEKIADILSSFKQDTIKQTKDMYQRNLDILHNYEDYNISNWLPKNAKILSKSNKKGIITINDIPVQITPSQIYSFEREDNQYIGAIWFIAKLEGFKKSELGIFTEALYIYLVQNFENKYTILPINCLAIDVIKKEEVNYRMVTDRQIPSLLLSALDEIKEANK